MWQGTYAVHNPTHSTSLYLNIVIQSIRIFEDIYVKIAAYSAYSYFSGFKTRLKRSPKYKSYLPEEGIQHQPVYLLIIRPEFILILFMINKVLPFEG